jgi:hypothetical protein
VTWVPHPKSTESILWERPACGPHGGLLDGYGETAFTNPNFGTAQCQPPDYTGDQPNGTSCQSVEGLNGTCSNGSCQPVTCKYNIDCPDGYVRDAGNTWHCLQKSPGTGMGAPCSGLTGTLVGTRGPGFFCCADMVRDGLGHYAAQDEAGRCADCCGPPFDGKCVSPDDNSQFCGGCVGRSNVADDTGHDCDDLENACCKSLTCSFGNCVGASASFCPELGEACTLPVDPTRTGSPLCALTVDPACTDVSQKPDYPNCALTCQTDLLLPVECENRPCDNDSDCCDNQACLVTCTGAVYGNCSTSTAPGAVTADGPGGFRSRGRR